MAAAGAPAEAIVIAVEAIEQAELETKQRRARNAERMRVVRAQSAPCADDVRAQSPVPPSPPSPLKEKSPTPPKENNPSSPLNPPFPLFSGGCDATRPSVDQKFDEFKKIYPKRDGANPWQPARKKFVAAVKSGHDPEAIIAGARRYSAECQAKNSVGTSMVAQALTWLNQQRWTDYAPPVTPKSRDGPTPEKLAERQRMIEMGGRMLNGQANQNPGPEAVSVVPDGSPVRPDP